MKPRMILALALTVLVAFAGGCSLNKEFVDRMDVPASVLLPDLRKVYKGEVLNLDEGQRSRRLLLLDEWEKTIKTAKEQGK